MKITVTIPIAIMDWDFAADVEVSITARSKPETRWSSAEGCEWHTEEIRVRPNGPPVFGTAPYVSAPEWLRNMIAESDELADAVADAERDEPRGRAARDPDEARERMRDK
jgi:hypothetical protein